MRCCTKHPSDLSSSVGVCASCLRERLFVLIAAQARQQSQIEEDRRKSDRNLPPPLIFPKSVSPYICSRSDHHQHHINNDRRFYSTPQVGPTTTTTTPTTGIKNKQGKFSLFSSFFRSSGSEEREIDRKISRAKSSPPTISTSSWFLSLISGRRKKQSRLCYLDEAASAHPRPRRMRDRGMSPTAEEKDEDVDRSTPVTGYMSESSPGWKKSGQTPRRRGSQHSRNPSGLAFCLSPLVRASPNRQWNQKEATPPAMVFPGEIGRCSKKPHLSTAASFCANRSRKLADFGRYNSFNT